jgi:hypothetical protein
MVTGNIKIQQGLNRLLSPNHSLESYAKRFYDETDENSQGARSIGTENWLKI